MPYKIAVASGKGGTGKTTVSVNLFLSLYEKHGGNIQLVDCDVEEPNDLIFFADAERTSQQSIYQQIPVIDTDICTFCKKCVEYCEFNALTLIESARFAEVNLNLCHSCGACTFACTYGAITEHPQSIGVVNTYETPEYTGLVEGNLKIGSEMQTMLISEMKKTISDNNRIVIYDAPPGTSCPVVATISDVDYILLVAEPTLFGMHDLKLMVRLVRELNKEFGVIINKAGLGNDDIYGYLKDEKIDLIGEIPFSKEYASLYAEGNITVSVPENISKSYLQIMEALQLKTNNYEGNNNTKR